MTNTDCTLYRYDDGGYERVYIPKCFWQDSCGVKISTGGFIPVDEVLVYIPEEYAEFSPRNPKKDILVRGNCSHVFDNSNEVTVSASLRKLNTEHETVTVSSVLDKLYGTSLRHIKVVAK